MRKLRHSIQGHLPVHVGDGPWTQEVWLWGPANHCVVQPTLVALLTALLLCQGGWRWMRWGGTHLPRVRHKSYLRRCFLPIKICQIPSSFVHQTQKAASLVRLSTQFSSKRAGARAQGLLSLNLQERSSTMWIFPIRTILFEIGMSNYLQLSLLPGQNCFLSINTLKILTVCSITKLVFALIYAIPS